MNGKPGIICLVILLCCSAVCRAQEGPVIDSCLSREEALAAVDPRCPRDILRRQEVVTLTYYSFDGRLHQGQLVIDRSLAQEVKEIFALARSLRFPIGSVIPLSDARFREGLRWSDERSMRANNSSGFNYRSATGSARLSAHAFGHALDINPVQNPSIKADTVLPESARYDPRVPGTLYAGHPIVEAFLARGWTWGGSWNTPKDYQHFEKVPEL